MFVKPLTAVVMMLATTVAACAAPANESDDVDESASTTTVESAALRSMNDAPQPLDYPVPVMPQMRDLRDWDLPRLARETMNEPISNCELHIIKLYDPARQKDIQVAVTVCP